MTSYWWIQFKAWNNTSWSCANKTWILTDFFSVVSTSAVFNGIEITKEKKNEDVARYEGVKSFDQKTIRLLIIVNQNHLPSYLFCFYFWFSFVISIPFNNAEVETTEKNSVKIHILVANDQNVFINTLNQIHQWLVRIL